MLISDLLKRVFGHGKKTTGYFTSVWYYDNEKEELLEPDGDKIRRLEETLPELYNLLVQNKVQPFFVELTRSSDLFWKLNLPDNPFLDGNTLKLVWYPQLKALYVQLAGEALVYTRGRWVKLPGVYDDRPPAEKLKKALALAAV